MEYNVDNSFIHYNESVFDIFKSKNKTLDLITFQNNCLTLGTKSINLGYYRLSTIPLMVVMKDAVTFFDVVDVCSEIANNLWQSNNTSYEVSLILNSTTLDDNYKNKIDNFLKLYNKARNFEDYLTDDLATEFSSMKQVINNILYFTEAIEMTSAKEYLKSLLLAENKNNSSKDKSKSRLLALTNPDFPTSDENQNDLNNYGFVSIVAIVLVVAVALVFIIKEFIIK